MKLVCRGRSRSYPSVTAKVYRRSNGEYSVEARCRSFHRSRLFQLDGFASAIDAFAEGLMMGEGCVYVEGLLERRCDLPPYPYK